MNENRSVSARKVLGTERALFVLGVAFSMFFDGIVLHQMLQWHHMASHMHPPDTLRNLQFNTLIDGLFHAAAWVVGLWGVVLMVQNARRGALQQAPKRLMVGAFLVGWGAFNVFENIVNHFVLQTHHVRENVPNVWTYNIGYLLVMGFGVMFVGLSLLARGRDEVTSDE